MIRIASLIPSVLAVLVFASSGVSQALQNSHDRGGDVDLSPDNVLGVSSWRPLILDGHELHSSLNTQKVDEPIRHLPSRITLPRNPYASTSTEFVEAVAGSSSQGKLGRDGVRSALYAFYVDEDGMELGFYGLEASSVSEALWLEETRRKTWIKNISLGRAQVHRKGLIVVVVWHDGVSPECWSAVNATVAERLDISWLTAQGIKPGIHKE